MPGKENQGRRGVALLAVLWVLTLLALMAASLTRTTRTEISLARNLSESARAEALADAGVELAVAKLRLPAGAEGWVLDGAVHEIVLEDGEIRVSVADEAGKIDVNLADEALLEALFRAAGLERDDSVALAQAVIDFRDSDSLRQLNGAEDDDYAEAGRPFGAKDSPFEVVEDLRQVMGMTAALYAEIAPALTVHARRPRPDPRTAPPLVAAALAGRTLEDTVSDENEEEPEGGAEEESLAAGALRSRIGTYAVHAEGRTAEGAVFARDAVLRLRASATATHMTLSWRQGRRTLFQEAESEVED